MVPSAASADESSAQAYARLKPAIVKIWSLDRSGVPADTGTGFIVSSDATSSIVVTALHVISNAAKITVDIDRDTANMHGTVIAKNPASDIAIIKLDRGGLKAASFAMHAPAEGDQIAVAGFPGSTTADTMIEAHLGEKATLIGTGSVGSIFESGREVELANLPIEHGLSGGPAFDPATGDVVAMVDAKLEDQHRGFGISAQPVVVALLKANSVAYVVDTAPRPAGGVINPEFTGQGDAQQTAMQKMFFQENYSGAASMAADYLLTHPDDNVANAIMVATLRSLFVNHSEAEAVRAATMYRRSHPTNSMANAVLAASMRTSAPEESIQRFEALGVIPNEMRSYAVEAYYNGAQISLQAGDKATAIKRLSKANENGGNDASRALLASLTGGVTTSAGGPAVATQRTLQDFNIAVNDAFRKGQEQAAIELATQSFSQYPNDGTIPYLAFSHFLSKGRAIDALGQHRAAIDYFEKSATLLEPVSKDYAIRLDVSAGEILEGDNSPKRADLDEAIRIRDHILALDPASGYANLWSAMLESTILHDTNAAKKHLLVAKAHASDFNETNIEVLNKQLASYGLNKDK